MEMKFVPSFLVFGIGFLTGGVLVWNFKLNPVSENSSVPAPARDRGRPDKDASASVASSFEADFKAIKEHSFQVSSKDSFRDFNHLQGLATALIKEAGSYQALEREEGSAFRQIVNAMAEMNLEQTLDWIDQFIQGSNRASVCQDAIRAGMKNSPVREQLDFFKTRKFTTEEIGNYAGNLMMGYETLSNETALYLLGHVQPSKGGHSGGHARFDDGFDFAGFAKATLEMTKAHDNNPPSTYPMNFFSEWTRSDPQAATDFYFTHCVGENGLKIPFATLEGFMKELRANIPDADYGQFVGTALTQQLAAGTPDNQMIEALVKAGISSPEAIAGSLGTLPDPIVRQKLFSRMLGNAAQASLQGGDLMQLRGVLSLYQNPPVRLESVENYVRKLGVGTEYNRPSQVIRNLCTQLAILGHSEADLQRVRSAAVKSDSR